MSTLPHESDETHLDDMTLFLEVLDIQKLKHAGYDIVSTESVRNGTTTVIVKTPTGCNINCLEKDDNILRYHVCM